MAPNCSNIFFNIFNSPIGTSIGTGGFLKRLIKTNIGLATKRLIRPLFYNRIYTVTKTPSPPRKVDLASKLNLSCYSASLA